MLARINTCLFEYILALTYAVFIKYIKSFNNYLQKAPTADKLTFLIKDQRLPIKSQMLYFTSLPRIDGTPVFVVHSPVNSSALLSESLICC